MPKLVGIDYYDAVKVGVDAAAKELPHLEVQWLGPTKELVEEQINLLESNLSPKPDLVAVAANDPVIMGDFLKALSGTGLHVMSWDGDARYRDFFVNLVGFDAFAKAIVHELVEETNASGEIAIITTSFLAPNQTAWIKAIRKLLIQRYPNISVFDIRPAGENTDKAFRVATDLLTENPNIKAIIALGVPNMPGVAQAVEEMGLANKVAVLGNSTPNLMRAFLKRGTVKSVVSWNAEDHGYLTVYCADRLLRGEIQGTQPFFAGRLGMVYPYRDNQSYQVSLPVVVLTGANVDQFNF